MEHEGASLVPFRIKAAGPDDGLNEGQFEGYASVFGNVDSYGDIVEPGAFTKTLAAWALKGDPIPLLWGHDFSDPYSNIGALDSATEDEHGLKVVGTFDLENPKAAQVYRLAKGRRCTGMSFAYNVVDAEKADDGYHLKELDLFEASIVPIGANPEAGVLAVKALADDMAAGMKAGRVLSSKNESALRDARDAIDSVLAALGDDEDGKAAPAADHAQEQASGESEVKSDTSDEEPAGAKSSVSDEEPKSSPSVETLAVMFSTYATAYAGQEGA